MKLITRKKTLAALAVAVCAFSANAESLKQWTDSLSERFEIETMPVDPAQMGPFMIDGAKETQCYILTPEQFGTAISEAASFPSDTQWLTVDNASTKMAILGAQMENSELMEMAILMGQEGNGMMVYLQATLEAIRETFSKD